MKNCFTLLFLLVFTIGGFAQNSIAQSALVRGGESELKANLKSNLFVFEMPKETTTDEMKKAASYYTDYFSVEYDESTHVARVKFVNDDDLSRRVINRFFLTANVRTILFQEKSYTIMEFYSDFLKK